ncbi:Helicase conserved C-terminal domain-containing protein [Amphibacillus marinus]|uniref:Helicase conserved C-terminal domain-containing protein n=1 Tax=Amphibacillus marinus TaxID=872970 RepID=A0A1H8NMM4_9BACI|nr:SNF2-related protein [Amphibacillus marinus]SEO30855.1 Helicase conserved C-terminal domain-containing protein [Amphibacillus marinus]
MHIELNRDLTFVDHYLEKINQNGPFSDWKSFERAYQVANTLLVPSSNTLKALEQLKHVRFLQHQIDTVKKVMHNMNGRAILADEVGLGKTIEAGLILKEYMLRGLITKALIIVPASLVNQWASELYEKFFIRTTIAKKNPCWSNQDVMITSIDLIKREPHRSAVLEQHFDFLLIDEAHKLKNHQTKNYQLIQALSKKYCLLLTATPIQNKLTDIFNLVTLLRPGLLGDQQSFLKTFDKGTTVLDDQLKRLIQKVMVRNLRHETELDFTKRHVETITVTLTDEELAFYHELEQANFTKQNVSRTLFLREFCSSREALYTSLLKQKEQHTSLLTQIEQLPHHAKALKLVELIKSINDKCIVFTEYRATQIYLQWLLKEHGISSVPFRGGFKRGKKDWMKQLFKDHAQVLIATEAGGEGINLQFCHHLVNYDLPWNPMRVEQRIGRIHRFGQEHDVKIYNFSIENTIEDHVLQLLYKKIHLFQRVIGHLDQILADLNIGNIEDELTAIMQQSTSIGEVKIKMDNLAEVIAYHDWSGAEHGNRESS